MTKSPSAIEVRVAKLMALAEAQYKIGTPKAIIEADAYVAKAQRMIAKYSLDEELIRQRAQQAGQAYAKPTTKVRNITEGPYRKHRSHLASRVAMAMGLEVRICNKGTYVIFVGFETDADLAWQVFCLIEAQMMRSAEARIKRGEHRSVRDWSTNAGHMSAQTWKANYFESYIYKVCDRIMANRAEEAESLVLASGYEQDGQVVGRVTGTLVLVDRQAAVQKFYEEKYPVAKYKNGKAKPKSFWKAPTAVKRDSDAMRAGRADGAKARITASDAIAS